MREREDPLEAAGGQLHPLEGQGGEGRVNEEKEVGEREPRGPCQAVEGTGGQNWPIKIGAEAPVSFFF